MEQAKYAWAVNAYAITIVVQVMHIATANTTTMSIIANKAQAPNAGIGVHMSAPPAEYAQTGVVISQDKNCFRGGIVSRLKIGRLCL